MRSMGMEGVVGVQAAFGNERLRISNKYCSRSCGQAHAHTKYITCVPILLAFICRLLYIILW